MPSSKTTVRQDFEALSNPPKRSELDALSTRLDGLSMNELAEVVDIAEQVLMLIDADDALKNEED